MNEEIMRVLKMVEDGKIPASEAAKLIFALNRAQKTDADWIDLNQAEQAKSAPLPENEAIPESSGRKPSWMFIMVDGGEKKKVRVRIPIKLARWALKFIPKSAQVHMKEEFGSEFDFKDIEHILDELPTNVDLVDVTDEESGEHVRIFVR